MATIASAVKQLCGRVPRRLFGNDITDGSIMVVHLTIGFSLSRNERVGRPLIDKGVSES